MLRIYGASDDLIELEGAVRYEIQCYSGNATIQAKDPETGEGVAVQLILGVVWAPTIQPLPTEDGAEFPWPVQVKTKGQLDDPRIYLPDYSVYVEIECGDDVEIEVEKHDR